MKFKINDIIVYKHTNWHHQNIMLNKKMYLITCEKTNGSLICRVLDENRVVTENWTHISKDSIENYVLLSEIEEQYPEVFL